MAESVLLIRYNFWVSGTLIGVEKRQCIQSIEIKETVSGADTATIVISDPNFLFIEDDIFIENNSIKIMLGWDGTTYRVTFNGYISAIDIDFPSDGVPKLTMTCMDETHKMNREAKDETFTNCTSADVVKRKCAAYGFTCVIDEDYSFAVQETITQSKQTDIEFITKLAEDEVYPFTARLVGNTFYYVKKGKIETPKMSLSYVEYPHTIISFKPKINKETKEDKVSSSKVTTSDKSVSSTSIENTSSSGSASADGSTSYDNGGSTSATSSKTKTYNPVTKKWE